MPAQRMGNLPVKSLAQILPVFTLRTCSLRHWLTSERPVALMVNGLVYRRPRAVLDRYYGIRLSLAVLIHRTVVGVYSHAADRWVRCPIKKWLRSRSPSAEFPARRFERTAGGCFSEPRGASDKRKVRRRAV